MLSRQRTTTWCQTSRLEPTPPPLTWVTMSLPAFNRRLSYKRLDPMKGRDVLAVERTLEREGFRKRKPVLTYGWRARENVKAFQADAKLRVTGVYDLRTHQKLAPLFDDYDRWLYNHSLAPAKPVASPRDKLMRAVWALYATKPWDYHLVRPFLLYSWTQRIRYHYDCSWFATQVYYRARLPDPNGYSYKGGYGNTESLRGQGVRVNKALPGDLVFYGSYGSSTDPAHVVVAVAHGNCIGHGSTGGPRLLPQTYRDI